jgi:hypothetical protein
MRGALQSMRHAGFSWWDCEAEAAAYDADVAAGAGHLIGIVQVPAHSSPAQHPSDAHDCPIWAQPVPPPLLPLPLPLPDPDPDPPSAPPPLGGVTGVHVPLSAPGGITHVIPAQQSAVEVHAPLVGTQLVVAHSRTPLELGTQGAPLQQSAAVAHVLPGSRHWSSPASDSPYARHRGTPSLSSWHARNFGD